MIVAVQRGLRASQIPLGIVRRSTKSHFGLTKPWLLLTRSAKSNQQDPFFSSLLELTEGRTIFELQMGL